MSDSSMSRVTITLGRSGQVVKRAGAVVDSAYTDPIPSVGAKRSVHDRLGTHVELNSKRHRGNDNGLKSANGVDAEGAPLRKDDLRYKIMQKSGKKGTEGDSPLNGVDLREMLSRQARPSTSVGMQKLIPEDTNGGSNMPDRGEVRQLISESRGARPHIPEDRDSRQRLPNTREVRQRIPELREVRQRMPELREVRERVPEMREVRERVPEMREIRERVPEMREVRDRMPEMREIRARIPDRREVRERLPDRNEVREQIPERRERMLEAREVRQRMPEPRDDRPHMPEPTGASMIRRVPSSRGVDATPQIDSFRNSYSPLTMDRIRRRSPDGVLVNSRGVSPPRSVEELRRRQLIRSYDDGRSAAFMGKDSFELPRPMGTTSYRTNSAVAAGPAKRVGPTLAAPSPPGAVMHRSSYTVNEPHTVDGFLRALSLEKYAINFKAEEVDMHALRQMGDRDLKELGVPMGPRKKILLALLPRSRGPM
ncbi:Sterile alpha motif domain-containing protein [Heracleum sosnowskyi]|uniref:Sterile alpha motif domain-containing protein n=1 Tax=Heracleum sosnowskyi TaxID=360622 RepID=A0AAD8I1V2_9APIA|nr:Sterile alpha motif domain-containing protein [Heracleum sosnowskyi]